MAFLMHISASSPEKITGKPLRAFHGCAIYASRFYWSTRAWSSARFRLSPAEGSPHRHTLNEPSRPEPRGRICSLVAAHLL